MVRLKRAYDPPESGDGFRVLVDRLWPRGVSKERAALDLWLKEAGPSDGLRRWFGHDPARWPEFATRYRQELAGSEAYGRLRDLATHHDPLTLVYAARDRERNNAVVLRELLEGKEA